MEKRLFWLALGLGLLVAGCGAKGAKLPEDVAATVDGQNITVAEVQKVAQNFIRQNIPPDSTAEGATNNERIYNTALQRLVEQKVLEKAAVKAGITVADSLVQNRVSQLKAQVGGQESFDDLLKKNGATEADVVHDMHTNMLLGDYFNKVMEENPTVTDQEIEDYYNAHPETFGPDSQVHASHILVKVDQNADAATKAKAKAKAQSLLAKLKGGADFATLAKENSEDPGSGSRGGDLGWFERGRMVAPFDSAAFALEPDQLSGIVQTQFGYHIIKVHERGRKLADVTGDIRNYLSQQKGQERFRALVDSLKAESKIVTKPAPQDVLTKLGGS
jgi:peptidyl-prolyl cis-trans isomerase C